MILRTQIEIKPFESQIDYSSRVFAIGSCFAQRIGASLEAAKFQTLVNPFGALFNPISIAQSVERIASNRRVTMEEIKCGAGGLFHYDFHSQLNRNGREETVESINSAVESAHHWLEGADWVVITLGTAWVYELRESGAVVANCHKQHPNLFERRRLSVEEVVGSLGEVIERYLGGKRVIITLSPIRHIADGLAENSLSKATLRVAIDELVSRFENVDYFPSYEVMVDDLRDYRFYDRDMVHPSPLGVEYIWDLFCGAAISEEARKRMQSVERIVRAANHRPRSVDSPQYKLFCEQQLRAIEEFAELDFSCERRFFESQLK